MTRKDCQLLADIIKRHQKISPNGVAKPIALELANNLKQDNPRFNIVRFLSACGFSD